MNGQSLGTQNRVGSRILEKRSIDLSKEEEHLLPRELQISLPRKGLRGEVSKSF